MTPGKITCDIDDDVFIVNALDVSMSEGMDESTFVEQIKKMAVYYTHLKNPCSANSADVTGYDSGSDYGSGC